MENTIILSTNDYSINDDSSIIPSAAIITGSSSIIDIINTTDKNTGKEIIFPTVNSLKIPNKPNYIEGKRTNINHYGTTELNDFTGTPEDLIHDIGADFKALRQPTYRLNKNGEFVEIKNSSILVNSKTNGIIGTNITDRYGVMDFDDGIYYFLEFLKEVNKHGYTTTPAFGKVWGDGARMFLQYKIESGEILDEPMEYYASLITSHDKSSGFIITLSAIRLFCQNQINRMLKHCDMKITLKHTEGNKNRIATEAAKMVAAHKNQKAALEEYCQSLANIKVTNEDIFNAYAKYAKLADMTSQRQVDNFSEQAGQLFACYNMDDVSNFRGTALGAYYAMTDMTQHVVPLRKTSDQSYIERGIEGNVAESAFIDTLVAMAH